MKILFFILAGALSSGCAKKSEMTIKFIKE